MQELASKSALLVAFNFPPSANVGVFRTLRFCRFLPESDWTTTVLTSPPIAPEIGNHELEQMIPSEVVVQRVPLVRPEDELKKRIALTFGIRKQDTIKITQEPKPKTKNNVAAAVRTSGVTGRQKLMELLFAIPDDRIGWKRTAVNAGLELVQQAKPAVVYATAPPFTSLLVGREIARRVYLPLVLDFRDPWTRVPWGPRNKSWLANRWVERLERVCVRDAAAVILNTPELEEDFARHYKEMPREKFVSITNGTDPEAHARVQQFLEKEPQSPRDGRPLRLLHPGSLYRNRDPRPIVDAIAKLKKQGIHVILEQVGYCDSNFDLMNYAAERDVSKLVEIKPAVPHEEMLERMAQVDGFILLQPGTGVQIPGKLFEMILYRKPILAVCIPGAVANVVERFRIGTIAESGNADSIGSAILKIARGDLPDAKFDEAIEHFDGRNLTRQLANVFDSILKKSNER